jgi:hypothetical protein
MIVLKRDLFCCSCFHLLDLFPEMSIGSLRFASSAAISPDVPANKR